MDDIRKKVSNGYDPDLIAVVFKRYGIGNTDLCNGGLVDPVVSRTRKDRMRTHNPDRLCSFILHQLGPKADGPCRVNHVIHNDYILAFHIADNSNFFHYIGFLS